MQTIRNPQKCLLHHKTVQCMHLYMEAVLSTTSAVTHALQRPAPSRAVSVSSEGAITSTARPRSAVARDTRNLRGAGG